MNIFVTLELIRGIVPALDSRLVFKRYVNYIKQRYTHSMTRLTFFVFSMQMMRQQCWRSNLKDPVLLLLKRLCMYFDDDCFPASGPPPMDFFF